MLGHYDPQIDGKLVVPGRQPVPVRFTLDSGGGGKIVSSPLVDKYHLLEAIGGYVETQDRGVGGAEPTEANGRLSAFEIGPYRLDKPQVALSRDRAGSLASEAISVNAGGNILRRFTVIINYVEQWVVLEPNLHFADPFIGDASGLLLEAQGADFRTFIVQRVIAYSPASEAGLHRGDQLTAIEGKRSSDYALWQFEEELKKQSAVALTVKRGGRTFMKTLTLRQLL
jgi:PDZ domain